MGVSGALFDMVKLLDVAKTVISKFSAEKVYEKSLKWATKYDKELEKIILKNQKEHFVPTLLLHSCCAPCSSYVLEYLSKFLSIRKCFSPLLNFNIPE